MPVTIYDVAKEAGVGIGTVSRAINNSPQISKKTKKRVLEAIKKLKYQPHTVAQSLARKKTSTIACIIPFFTGYFFVELLRGIQRRITDYNYDLILYSVDITHKKETFLERTLQERKVDGVLLVSLEINQKFANRFLRAHFPIVLVDSDSPSLDSISVDNLDGAYMATKHLIDLGYSKIAMIDGQLKSIPARSRFEGYKMALEKFSLSFSDEYFVSCGFETEADGFNKRAGYTAMQHFLQLSENRPRAVFVSSDIQAIGAMEAIKEQGLAIPQDVAIIGFDDIELAQYVGLSTMRQPIRQMGELAVEVLLEKISSESETVFKKEFKTDLVVRETCGGCMHWG
ncbi:substrate-binding domain-containing protein [candidate division KSB1 bacterium]|nr:substrate-binding domain-containing protein [candidate division KSB1 bacterium]